MHKPHRQPALGIVQVCLSAVRGVPVCLQVLHTAHPGVAAHTSHTVRHHSLLDATIALPRYASALFMPCEHRFSLRARGCTMGCTRAHPVLLLTPPGPPGPPLLTVQKTLSTMVRAAALAACLLALAAGAAAQLSCTPGESRTWLGVGNQGSVICCPLVLPWLRSFAHWLGLAFAHHRFRRHGSSWPSTAHTLHTCTLQAT